MPCQVNLGKGRYSRQSLVRKKTSPSLSDPSVVKSAAEKQFSSAHVLESATGTEKLVPERRVYSQGDLMLTAAPPFEPRKLRVKVQSGDSSGESDDEEHIVEIASPSSLFHSPDSIC